MKKISHNQRFNHHEKFTYLSPDAIISVHRLFDMLTRLSSSTRSSVNEPADMPEHQRDE